MGSNSSTYIESCTGIQIVVAGLMLSCLCVTTNLVDINNLNTLGQVSCFILVCCLGRDKQLSVKKAHVSAPLSFMLCGCLVMSTNRAHALLHDQHNAVQRGAAIVGMQLSI